MSVLAYSLRQVRRGATPIQAAVIAGIHLSLRDGSGALADPTLAEVLEKPARDLATFFRADLDMLRV